MKSRHNDIDALSAYLRRSSWTLIALVVAILSSFFGAGALWKHDVELESWHRLVARLAVSTELDAATLEGATRLFVGFGDSTARRQALRAGAEVDADIDSLKIAAAPFPELQDDVLAIQAAVLRWRAGYGDGAITTRTERDLAALRPEVLEELQLFAPVRELLENLTRTEEQTYLRMVRRRERAQQYIALLAVASVALLGLVMMEMRRHLWRQLRNARGAQALVADQNARLHEQTIALERTVRELQESEQLQASLADEARVLTRRLAEAQAVARLGYWEVDHATGMVHWSDEMYRLVGLEPGVEPAPTDYYLSCVHPDDQEMMRDVAADALTSARPFAIQHRLRGRDGVYRTMHAEGRVLTEGPARKLVGTVQDVTDRVMLEAQLQQAQKMEAVGRLAGGIAHDFNNILTVIMSYGEMARAEAGDQMPMRELLDEVLNAGTQAASLTRQLLTFSRGRLIQPASVDVRVVVRDLLGMLSRIVGEDVSIATDLAEGELSVYVDAHQLGQVFMNLCVNARDAMPQGGSIAIRTSALARADLPLQYAAIATADRYAHISVSDTGAGMDRETIARVFEPFFTTKPEGQGTGLGLSTAFGIISQAGGWMTVRSEPGNGTTFDVYLPVHEATASPPVTGHEFGDASRRILPARVLLVEDDANVRRTTRRNLLQLGYTVHDASDGVSALQQLAMHPIDIVLSDTIMPNMSGPELARRLAAERPALPVVLTSGYTAEAQQRHGPIPDGVTLLEKPYSTQSLDAAVQRGLRRHRRGERPRASDRLVAV